MPLCPDLRSLPFSFINRKRCPIVLRAATNEDEQKILKMYQDFEPKGSYQGLPPEDPERLIYWVQSMLDDGFNITGLSFDHEVVCHAAIFGIDQDSSEFILAVSPPFQNAGIGTQLTRIVKKISRELGYKRIWLCVEPYNTKARHIYSRLGFRYLSRQISEECEMLMDLKHDPVMQVPVSQIMKRDVCDLKPEDTTDKAIRIFLEMGLSGLPVTNSRQELIGFVTEVDVLDSWASERGITEIMTRDVISVTENTRLEEVIDLVHEARVKHLPVVKDKSTLVGIVSRRDILRHLFGKPQVD